MSLITIERDGVTLYVNSNLAKVSQFSDLEGNSSPLLSTKGLNQSLQLTHAEYQQFDENANNTPEAEEEEKL